MRTRSKLRVGSVLVFVLAAFAWAAPAAAGKAPLASPAGRLLFGSDRDWSTVPDSQLFEVDADGTGLTKLTNFPWWAVSPSVSPDGRRIAFTGIQPEAGFLCPPPPGDPGCMRAYPHATGSSHDLYVMNADGTHLVRLTNGAGAPTTPAWSPDGSRIAFSIWGTGCPGPCFARHIGLMNPDGSGLVQLTSGPDFDWHPTWSPDGSKIAFERDLNDGSGKGALEVMNRDGSGLRSLLSGPCCFFDPAWSPDGTRISFWNGSVLKVLNLGTGKVGTLATGVALGIAEFDIASASWSPDALWLAVGADEFSNGTALHVVSADGKTILLVPNGDLAADPQFVPKAS